MMRSRMSVVRSVLLLILAALLTLFLRMLSSTAVAEPLKLLVPESQFNTLRGVEVFFSGPVRDVRWTYDGKTEDTPLTKPTDKLWLPVQLPQGDSAVQVRVDSAIAWNDGAQMKSVVLKGSTPAPLHVTTDPGPWQLQVPRHGPYTFQFSAPIANPQQLVKEIHFSPNVPGHVKWLTPELAEFIPSKPLPSTTRMVLHLDGGPHSVVGVSGQFLPIHEVTRPFVTATSQYIIVREGQPETLTLYRGNKIEFESLCNTGVDNATPLGHFYIRFKATHLDMKGTNPNGSHYNVPDVKWVMAIDGNIAIHGFPRQSYGFPQSAGCVELPVPHAAKLFTMVHVGTPVTIEGPQGNTSNSASNNNSSSAANVSSGSTASVDSSGSTAGNPSGSTVTSTYQGASVANS
ncbi:L,D-transpeptidase [Alicyclobacillus sp. SP_1]|uniref:L,D-transpeptidase n=1 Tax=Alicyclobacillus sp. SP_1 TaxID=2942475 RepID=UPI002157F595|nr:L,D-transpeptidase [Alicyclobacillus sp. SP_1]